MIRTELCEMLRIEHPVIQAGMRPFDTAKLATAVTNADAFGPIRLLKNRYSVSAPKPVDKETRIAQEKEMFANLDRFREDVEKYVLIYNGDIEDGAVLCGEVAGRIDDLPTVKELIDRVITEAEESIPSLPRKIGGRE